MMAMGRQICYRITVYCRLISVISCCYIHILYIYNKQKGWLSFWKAELYCISKPHMRTYNSLWCFRIVLLQLCVCVSACLLGFSLSGSSGLFGRDDMLLRPGQTVLTLFCLLTCVFFCFLFYKYTLSHPSPQAQPVNAHMHTSMARTQNEQSAEQTLE